MPDLRAIDYTHGGDALIGRLAVPAGPGPHPAVMVMHDARGLGDLVIERARRLAALGYVALATDMYGGGVCYADAFEGGMKMMALHSEPGRLRGRVLAGYEALAAQPDVDAGRIAAIGFCFGGQCVLELARSGADVKAVVSYHGLLTSEQPARPGAVKAEVAVFSGGRDPYAPPEDIQGFQTEMTAAGARWNLTLYSEAYHAFTDPNASTMTNIAGVAYDPLADRLSWAATQTLLDALLH